MCGSFCRRWLCIWEALQSPPAKLLETTNACREVAGCRISEQKPTAFLYTNSDTSGKWVKHDNSFCSYNQENKMPRNELKGWGRPLYWKLQRIIKRHKHKWKDTPCSWAGRINIVKLSLLPKAINRFNVTPFKISVSFFKEIEDDLALKKKKKEKEIEEKIIRFVWNHIRP